MSKTLTVQVPDKIALDLESNNEVEVIEVHEDNPAEKQAELHKRMGFDPADDSGNDSTREAELADKQMEQLKEFLLRKRKDGIEK